MANLKTDSPLSRRIVLAFLDFLHSVEPAADVDNEGLEAAKECLTEVFKINRLSTYSQSKTDSLIDIFSSHEVVEQIEVKSGDSNEGFSADASPTTTSSAQTLTNPNPAESSQSTAEDPRREAQSLDELFGQWFSALEKIGYFNITPDGHDDQVQLDRATCLFHNAVKEMQQSGVQIFDGKNLAETFKLQGNKAVQSKMYSDAIELYTYAIALCKDNAVYYCNRAAAYTQMKKYNEAFEDCYKSIEIDQNYSKAYSRIGFAHYAQGNYMDAILDGFKPALQLDPNNELIKENIRAAGHKIREQYRTRDQHSSSSSNNEVAAGSSVMSFFDSGGNIPAEFADHFLDNNRDIDNIDVGDLMPGGLPIRSIMEMYSSRAAPHNNNAAPHNLNLNGRPAPS